MLTYDWTKNGGRSCEPNSRSAILFSRTTRQDEVENDARRLSDSVVCDLALRSSVSPFVRLAMTLSAQDNQILSGVVSPLAARLQVMDFEVLHAATALAPPAISRQNLSTQSEICIRLKL